MPKADSHEIQTRRIYIPQLTPPAEVPHSRKQKRYSNQGLEDRGIFLQEAY